jgi:hypothetical protein
MSAKFEGYSMRNIYPNWGVAVDQQEETIPDAPEQEAYATNDAATTATVSSKTKTNVWVLLGALLVIILLFGRG